MPNIVATPGKTLCVNISFQHRGGPGRIYIRLNTAGYAPGCDGYRPDATEDNYVDVGLDTNWKTYTKSICSPVTAAWFPCDNLKVWVALITAPGCIAGAQSRGISGQAMWDACCWGIVPLAVPADPYWLQVKTGTIQGFAPSMSV